MFGGKGCSDFSCEECAPWLSGVWGESDLGPSPHIWQPPIQCFKAPNRFALSSEHVRTSSLRIFSEIFSANNESATHLTNSYVLLRMVR